jgi:hypothetical protein
MDNTVWRPPPAGAARARPRPGRPAKSMPFLI